MEKLKIYFDTCCYNRPFDLSAPRVDREHKDIKTALRICKEYGFGVYGSKALNKEIGAIKDLKRLRDVLNFYTRTITGFADEMEFVDKHILRLCKQYNVTDDGDIHHLAYAVALGVDYLITVDDNFVKGCSNMGLGVKVVYPIDFIKGGYYIMNDTTSYEVREPVICDFDNIERPVVDRYAAYLALNTDRSQEECDREIKERREWLKEYLGYDSDYFDIYPYGHGDYTAEKQARNRLKAAQVALA